jgi:hypothetical protein
VTGGKPIAVLLQSISGVIAINPLVPFYDIHGRKREVLLHIEHTLDLILPGIIAPAYHLRYNTGYQQHSARVSSLPPTLYSSRLTCNNEETMLN